MNKKYLSIFLIALLFSSCGENKNSKNDVYENTIKGKKAELKKIGQFVIQEDSTAFIGRFRNVKFREGKLVLADMFKFNFMNFINFKNLITVYLYISPWYLEKIIENCKLKIENFHVVSYMYPVESLKNKKKIIKGKNKIFSYLFSTTT